jgi:hypothetical protein
VDCRHPSSVGIGECLLRAFVPAAKRLPGAYEEGIAGMLTIIKASLLGSALMLLEGSASLATRRPVFRGTSANVYVHDGEPERSARSVL